MLDYKNITLSTVADLVNKQLCNFLVHYPKDSQLYDSMQYVLLNKAKRYRPYLLYVMAHSLGLNLNHAIYIGCTIEMLHTYTLIHDDLPCMDDDDMRRGVPSCHKKFSESTAILTGDALQAEAFYWLACDYLDIPNNIKLKIIELTAQAVGANNLILGQVLDLQIDNNATEQQINKINLLKTAKLISLVFKISFILANKSSQDMEVISLYGEKLGLIFQIIDDYDDIDQHGANIVNILGKEKTKTMLYTLNKEALCILDQLGLSHLNFLTTQLLSKINV